MSENNSSDSLLGFLLGAAAGAVAGLLLAPRTGEETRKRLAEWIEDNREKARDFLDKERERLQHARESRETGRRSFRARHESDPARDGEQA